MSTARDDMIAALGAIEDALQQLATARRGYLNVYQTVSRAAYHGSEKNRQFTLELTLGSPALDGRIVQRMRTLGLQGVLEAARSDGTIDATWITALSEKVRAFV